MRKTQVKRRALIPDPRFGDSLVTQFVNNMMLNGKKSLAFDIFYGAIDVVDAKKVDEEKTALEIWKQALDNVMPHVEVRSRRVGGSNMQIPVKISDSRKLSMAIKWLIGFARKRNEKTMAQRLAFEIIAAYKEEGAAYKKKQDVHKMADANKAFSHYAR